MKNIKRNFIIGVIVAITSQIYWNFFVENFRISTSVIILPVLLMTIAKQQDAWRVGLFISPIIFFVRTLMNVGAEMPISLAITTALPAAMYYICYCSLFSVLVENKYTIPVLGLAPMFIICDYSANIIEIALKTRLNMKTDEGMFYLYLLVICISRGILAVAILAAERRYHSLLTREEHETRYQKLFLMTTGLTTEVYFMRKNSEEVEAVMSNAFKMYEKLQEIGAPPQTQKIALSIARDVHEIKKDYIGIIQGLENQITQEYNEDAMKLKDLFTILEGSTHRLLEERKYRITLDFKCTETVKTNKHYQLMSVMKNLISNAIEAITADEDYWLGEIKFSALKEKDEYVFIVQDSGTGIREKDLNKIFDMGFTTKYDEKTGNVFRGVGLAGVKMTVEEIFKGEISADSSKGKGAIFTVKIPTKELEVQG